ncbi:MAG TPA: LuxR C-terminal-related transcriptional regulator [Candidatus Limnocylindrales bacterium]|nr:LuxR C-terminal-related transcriptional regulator [Candidatus Limnocylindrales bacterium]
MLEALGLDPTSESVYRTMLIHPDWGISELSEKLGIDEKGVRKALDTLFNLTLLQPSMERPGELRPVSPEVGLHALITRQQDEMLRRQQEITRTQAAIADMVASYTVAQLSGAAISNPDCERIIGIDAIHTRLEQLTEAATRDIACFNPGKALSAEAIAAGKRNDARLLDRGIAIREIVEDAVRDDFVTLEHARWLTDAGGEVRSVPQLPPRMILIDGQIALLPIDPANTRVGMVQLTNIGVLASLTSLFEQVWSVALPLGADRSRDGEGPSPVERELLRLLGSGLTDEAAARRLGVSERTARRMMSEIMERLGARSRFEAGLKATQAGWL